MALDRGGAPLGAHAVIWRQVGRRKSAAQPELLHLVRGSACFADIQAIDFQRHGATQERFALVHHAGRGAAQQQVLAVLVHAPRPVHEHAQRLGQGGQVLDLVNHHQALQTCQRGHGVRQPLARDGVFKIEVMRAGDVDEVARQRGFAHLPGAYQFHCTKG